MHPWLLANRKCYTWENGLHHLPKALGFSPLKDRGFPRGSVVKNLPANAGDTCSIPGLGRSPGGENATLFCIRARRIPWTEEPDRLHDLAAPRLSN